jgi:nucleotide-binding universal stress UspA family protein
MFRHLLVPLDGSVLAEAALPAARHLSETTGADITLLHMIERNSPSAVHGAPHLTSVQDAEAYLAEIAQRTLSGVSRVHRHVHAGEIDDVAQSIVAHGNELHIDLIVLCTHGAGGVRHGLFGTVTQRVVALGSTPVLLVPTPPSGDGLGCSFQRVLVPLDGNPDHEQGLAALMELRPGRSDHVRLVMVIPKWRNLKQTHRHTSRTLPGTTVELLNATHDEAFAYLDEKANEIGKSRGEITAQVVRGEPVRAIVAAARDFRADLIVLGTHGTTHWDAFWSGSLTPQLAKASHLPMLLVPVVRDGKSP